MRIELHDVKVSDLVDGYADNQEGGVVGLLGAGAPLALLAGASATAIIKPASVRVLITVSTASNTRSRTPCRFRQRKAALRRPWSVICYSDVNMRVVLRDSRVPEMRVDDVI